VVKQASRQAGAPPAKAAYRRHLSSLSGTRQSILVEARRGLGRTEGFYARRYPLPDNRARSSTRFVTGHDGARPDGGAP